MSPFISKQRGDPNKDTNPIHSFAGTEKDVLVNFGLSSEAGNVEERKLTTKNCDHTGLTINQACLLCLLREASGGDRCFDCVEIWKSIALRPGSSQYKDPGSLERVACSSELRSVPGCLPFLLEFWPLRGTSPPTPRGANSIG